MRAIVYMGTGCSPDTTKYFVDLFREMGMRVEQVCWTKDKPLRDLFRKDGNTSLAYGEISKWNTQKGLYDIAVGHSAGGFPLSRTNARFKIGLNIPFPFLTGSTSRQHIFRADGDWLVAKPIQETLGRDGQYSFYNGGHSTVPKSKIRAKINEWFPQGGSSGRSRRL